MEVTYEMVAGSVGSLLLVWSRIESTARYEIVRALGQIPKSAHGIAAVLRTWEGRVIADHPINSLGPSLARMLRQELQHPLEVRNGICHGLIGFSTQSAADGPALHWEINGEKSSITWDALQDMLGRLSKFDRAFALISQPSLDRLGSRGIDNEENREWWMTEFSLDLSNKRDQRATL